MSNLTTTSEAMMSSKEIAELTGKRHADVMRDIRSIMTAAEKGNADLRYQLNQGLTEIMCPVTHRTGEFMMNRFFSEVLVTGYDVVRRAKVITRWLELESKVQQQLPDFNNPVEAARAWADAKEEAMIAESRVIEHQKKIKEDAPKVSYYEHVGDAEGLMTMGEAIKQMNLTLGRNEAYAVLRSMRILQSNQTDWNQPYQQYINQGYFKVKQKVLPNNKRVSVTLVTPKGHQWLFKKLT